MMSRVLNRTMRVSLGLSAVSFALALPVATASGSIVLDDFTSASHPWPAVLNSVGFESVIESPLVGVFGSVRATTITASSIELPGTDFLSANVTGGMFDYNSTAGAHGSISLLYDAGGDGLAAFLADQHGIRINFNDFDHAGSSPLPVTITLFDGLNFATLTQSVTGPGQQPLSFDFDDFDNINGLGLPYVQSIRIDIDAGPGTDFRISNISTYVPVPGVAALLSIAGVVGLKKRRR